MQKLLSKLVTAASLVLIVTGSAQAAVYTEDFEQDFPAWESNWFGTMSDAMNVYCIARNCTNRGNNPDGLWLGGTSAGIQVNFDNAFGSSLTSFSLDVAAYGAGRFLSAYDMAGNLIFNQAVVPTSGAYSDPGVYTNFTINSSNGIARFEFSAGANGNTSIDNLIAITAVQNDVPEPASMGLLGLGLLGVFAARSRRQ